MRRVFLSLPGPVVIVIIVLATLLTSLTLIAIDPRLDAVWVIANATVDVACIAWAVAGFITEMRRSRDA